MIHTLRQKFLFGETESGQGIDSVALLLCTLLLLSVGIVMVATSSMDVAAYQYGDPWYFVKRQGVYLLLALGAGFTVYQIPASMWQNHGWLLIFASIFLLLIVLLPGIGHEVNGSRRWLRFGFLTLQVSEFVKFFCIISFASYLRNSQHFLQTQWHELLKPLMMLVMVMLLLLLEPDFGASVVLAVAVGGMLFFAGAKLWQCFLLIFGCAGILVCLVLYTPYRLQRINTFLDPWGDEFGKGYQLVQSLIAFGRGEWFGLGLGNSIQKLLYLPEAHTDFVFAIFAEEQGFVGVLALLALFGVFVFLIFRLTRRAMDQKDIFITLVSFGFGVLFSIQVFINVGVASGFLPTKGLTLPFISYGGSSLLASCMAVGLLLRLERDLFFGKTAVKKGRAS